MRRSRSTLAAAPVASRCTDPRGDDRCRDGTDASVIDAADGSRLGGRLGRDRRARSRWIPAAAVDPDPNAETKAHADDEAADAPDRPRTSSRKLPPAPTRAPRPSAEAVRMIKDGKRDLALTSLHALWKKSPKSSYIPFLLGNLYFDKLWWSVAMEHYKTAIVRERRLQAERRPHPEHRSGCWRAPRPARTADAFLRFDDQASGAAVPPDRRPRTIPTIMSARPLRPSPRRFAELAGPCGSCARRRKALTARGESVKSRALRQPPRIHLDAHDQSARP